MAKVLYIAGYGRSGSTVLGIILGNHPEIAYIGEVSNLLDDWTNSDRVCSCGAPYEECEFWKALFPSTPPTSELAKLVRKIERIFFLPRLLSGLVTEKDRRSYQAYQDKLFDRVTSRTDRPIVVDSSKSAWLTVGRFLALHKFSTQDVCVLHLVRNGLATMESQLVTGDNRTLEGLAPAPRWLGLRSALGWVSANVWVQLLGRLLDPNRYMLLRYEDFMADPAKALQSIGQLCGFDAGALIVRINRGDYFPVGHVVGGNRVRLQGKVKLKREIRQNHGDGLKPYQRLLFTCVGGWLQRYYGYP